MNTRTCYRLDGHVRKSLDWMSQELEAIFRELGLVQYLHVFVEQGFDTWDTILDITESDLDALGVKLGHRRKLQRRIANTRGIGNGISLVTSPQPSVEDPKIQLPQPTKPLKLETRETNTVVITKRKYRRHPKPDENAPERPPSAYVLFSNKMRDELKGRNLTFTEIAKLVGENWQSLSQGEKEPFESQAQAIKDKYHSDLAEYKKTPEYRKYMLYLQDFKAKHAAQSQDKEGSKRVKLEWASQNSADATPSRTSRSGSGSEERQGSDPPPNRKLNSEPPAKKEAPYSPTPTQTSHHASPDGSVHSPLTASVDRHSAERSPTFSSSPRDPPSVPPRHPNWHDDQREHFNHGMSLPSLSDVIERQRLMGAANPEAAAFGFPRDHMSHSPGPAPSLISSDGRTPLLRKDESGSASSGSSYGFPRTPIEGSLPIHALLASKPNQFEPNQQQSYFQGVPLPSEHKSPFLHQGPNGSGPPATNGFHNGHSHAQPPSANRINHAYGTQSPPATLPQPGKSDPRLDGMSALLKAGEIVDRRAQ